MARKLKVYRTPIGFHDAYVAATSQKEALKAWGSDADLFARGMAEAVTDATLTAEPLDRPGTVVRRARGTSAEHLAALPKDEATPKRRSSPTLVEDEGVPPRRRRKVRSSDQGPSARKARMDAPRREPEPAPSRKPPPKPSRAKLDEAERAIEDAHAIQEAALVDIRHRQKALENERRQIEERYDADLAKLETAAEKARDRYRSALEKWRA